MLALKPPGTPLVLDQLPSGAGVALIVSRKILEGVKEGLHLLAVPSQGQVLTPEEEIQLLAWAFRMARKHAFESGRYLVYLKGPEERKGAPDTREAIHIHVVLLKGDDEVKKFASVPFTDVHPDVE
jgi:hypothetical protein